MLRKISDRLLGSREFRNASWLIIGKLIQIVLSFITSIFITRYLGPSNYGTINYAMAYVAFFTSLCTLGINSIIIKDFADSPEEQGTAIGTTLILRAISGILSSLMCIGIVSIVDKGEATTIVVTGLCSCALIFQIFDTINFWFQAKYKSKVTAIVSLFAYLSVSIYKIILLILNKNVMWFAFASSVDYIAYAIVILAVYKKYKGPKFNFSIQKGKHLLSRSYHYILSGMMVAVYGQTDKLMLKQMLDETTVGYYSLASSISMMWCFVLQAIIDSFYPTIINLYAKDYKLFEKANKKLYATVIYISILVSILFMIFGKFIVLIFYSKDYLPSVEPLKIITWYTVFSYLGVARNAWIVCENKQKYLKYMYASAACINVILNYFMIPIWGASGAAMASLITQICTSMVLPYFIKDMRPNVKLMVQAFTLRNLK